MPRTGTPPTRLTAGRRPTGGTQPMTTAGSPTGRIAGCRLTGGTGPTPRTGTPRTAGPRPTAAARPTTTAGPPPYGPADRGLPSSGPRTATPPTGEEPDDPFLTPPDADDERGGWEDGELEAEENEHIKALTGAAEAGAPSAADAPLPELDRRILDRMQRVADRARGRPDAKTRRLVEWIRANLCPGLPPFSEAPAGAPPRWNDRRVLVFTENRQGTKRYLRDMLEQAVEGTDRADERIETIDGRRPTPPARGRPPLPRAREGPRPRFNCKGTGKGRSGTSSVTKLMAADAAATPRPPATRPRPRLSTATCRTSLNRLAPRARRIDISRRRTDASASRRPEMLAQTMSRRVPTSPVRTARGPKAIEGRRASFGRLREGVGIDEARTRLDVIGRRLHQSYPEDWTGLSGPRALTIRAASS